MKYLSSEDLDDLDIHSRIMANEALRRNYRIRFVDRTTPKPRRSRMILCEKDGVSTIFFWESNTALNSSLGIIIQHDKITTYDILRRANLPIPPTFILRRADADKTSRELLDFLDQHKPLVVKPSNTDHGDGITVGVVNKKDLIISIKYALDHSIDADVLLQQQITGKEFRFLVLRNKVIAVANRRPPFVVGDGIKTLRELTDIKNSDPQRGQGHSSPLTKIKIDEVEYFLGAEMLDTVPAKDLEIELLKTSNLSRGGEAIDYTDIASHELKEFAVQAAHECLLGIAGVDIITSDIKGKAGVIIEVNSSPGLRMHQFPSIGKPRDVAKMIFDELEKNAS